MLLGATTPNDLLLAFPGFGSAPSKVQMTNIERSSFSRGDRDQGLDSEFARVRISLREVLTISGCRFRRFYRSTQDLSALKKIASPDKSYMTTPCPPRVRILREYEDKPVPAGHGEIFQDLRDDPRFMVFSKYRRRFLGWYKGLAYRTHLVRVFLSKEESSSLRFELTIANFECGNMQV